MIRISVFLSLSALIVSFNPGSAPSQRIPKANEDISGHDRLCVTIWPEKTRIKGNEVFEVKLRVVNSSEQVQTFRVMNCRWDQHWQCSNSRIAQNYWRCFRNFPITVHLDPGEAYEQKQAMYVGAKGDSKTERFRMGFTPIGQAQTYWSNEVVLGLQ